MRKILLISCMAVVAFAFTSCKDSPSYIYNVPKGDVIEVDFDSSKTGYFLSGNSDSFSVGDESKTVVEGAFSNWSLAEMEYYLTTNEASITDSSDKELVWDDLSTLGVEYNVARQLSDKTILIMTAKGDEATVNDIYDRLYFSIVDPDSFEAQGGEDTENDDNNSGKSLLKSQPSNGADPGSPLSIFNLNKISFTVPGNSTAKKVSDYEYVITADKSIIELELAPVGKNMVDGAMTVKGYVNNIGGDLKETDETRINGFLMGVAMFSVGGQQEKAYIFTVNKKAYALKSRDAELLDSVISTLKFG